MKRLELYIIVFIFMVYVFYIYVVENWSNETGMYDELFELMRT